MKGEPVVKTHMQVVAWINIVYGAFEALVGLFVLGVLTSIGAIMGDWQAAAVLGTVGVGAFLIVLSLPSIIAGIGLLQGKGWARVLTLVLAALSLFSFPFGTALAIYTFWVLTDARSAQVLGAAA